MVRVHSGPFRNISPLGQKPETSVLCIDIVDAALVFGKHAFSTLIQDQVKFSKSLTPTKCNIEKSSGEIGTRRPRWVVKHGAMDVYGKTHEEENPNLH